MLRNILLQLILLLLTIPSKIETIAINIQKNDIPKYMSDLNLIKATNDNANEIKDNKNANKLIIFKP